MTASRTSRRPADAARARSRRLVTAAAGVGIAAALALAGCSSGLVTQTASQVPAVPGANADAGDIALRNLVIVYDTPAGYPAGAEAPLVIRIFNNGTTPVTLIGVTAAKAASVALVGSPDVVTPSEQPPPPASPTATASPGTSPTATESPGATASPTLSAEPPPTSSPTPPPTSGPLSILIPPQSYVLLVPGQGTNGHLRLVGLTEAIAPGESTNVTFTFDNGATVTLAVPLAPPLVDVTPRASAVVDPGHAEPVE